MLAITEEHHGPAAAAVGALTRARSREAARVTVDAGTTETELGMELAGIAAVVGRTPQVTAKYLYARCLTIAGGTSEIMRNNIAERSSAYPEIR